MNIPQHTIDRLLLNLEIAEKTLELQRDIGHAAIMDETRPLNHLHNTAACIEMLHEEGYDISPVLDRATEVYEQYCRVYNDTRPT